MWSGIKKLVGRLRASESKGDGTTDHRTTNEGGRFELRGIGKSEGGYRLTVLPSGQQYFSRGLRIPDTPGLEPIEATIELVSGIVVKGRVTRGETGKPIAGAPRGVQPPLSEPIRGPLDQSARGPGIVPCSWTETGPDGSYAFVVLPRPRRAGLPRAIAQGDLYAPRS